MTSAPDSVVVAKAPGGEILFSNRYAERVVGRTLSEIAGDFPIFHLDGRPYAVAELQIPRSLSSGKEILDEEFLGPASEAGPIRYRCSCWPVHDDGGQIVAAVAVTRDVTETARAGEALIPPEREQADRGAIDSLTPRELEVLRALAEGLDSQAIADRLYISVHTERNHVARILAKLGVHSRLQALVFAIRHGIVNVR